MEHVGKDRRKNLIYRRNDIEIMDDCEKGRKIKKRKTPRTEGGIIVGEEMWSLFKGPHRK